MTPGHATMHRRQIDYVEGIPVPRASGLHKLITPAVAGHLRTLTVGSIAVPRNGQFKLVFDLHNGLVARVYKPPRLQGEDPEHPGNVRVPELAPVTQRDVVNGVRIDQMENVEHATELVAYHLVARFAERGLSWTSPLPWNCGINGRGDFVVFDGAVWQDEHPEYRRYAVVDRQGVLRRWLTAESTDQETRYSTFDYATGQWLDSPADRKLFEQPTGSATEFPLRFENAIFRGLRSWPWDIRSNTGLRPVSVTAPDRGLKLFQLAG